jgi:hypothetical protein
MKSSQKRAALQHAPSGHSSFRNRRGALYLNQIFYSGDRMRAFLLSLLLFSVSSAQADDKQPKPSKMAACRIEAAKRFIDDFVQVGPVRETAPGSQILIASFQNDPQLYELYVDDCLKRK